SRRRWSRTRSLPDGGVGPREAHGPKCRSMDSVASTERRNGEPVTASGPRGGTTVDRFSVVLVAVAATLWASDAYFRNQLVGHLGATEIVVAEDALITLFLLPVLLRSWREVRHLGIRGWVAVAVVGVYLVVFAQDPTAPVSALQKGRVEVGLLALGAAALWASGTVLGRFALGSISFWSMTSLRFTLAL